MCEYKTINGIYGAVLEYIEMPSKGSVVICPGGGYSMLSEREMKPVAKAFANNGYMPFVLSYYVAGNRAGEVLHTIPLEQAGWAVSTAKTINPNKPVFICGFSAGGHLAASLGVHFCNEKVFGDDETQLELRRPDGMILSYPVISTGEYRHAPSIERLCGHRNDSFFSLEKQVHSGTPPAFIWHTATDETVPVENAILMEEAMRKARVPVHLVIYPRGVHGLSLATVEVEEIERNRNADKFIAGWFRLCVDWMKDLIE